MSHSYAIHHGDTAYLKVIQDQMAGVALACDVGQKTRSAMMALYAQLREKVLAESETSDLILIPGVNLYAWAIENGLGHEPIDALDLPLCGDGFFVSRDESDPCFPRDHIYGEQFKFLASFPSIYYVLNTLGHTSKVHLLSESIKPKKDDWIAGYYRTRMTMRDISEKDELVKTFAKKPFSIEQLNYYCDNKVSDVWQQALPGVFTGLKLYKFAKESSKCEGNYPDLESLSLSLKGRQSRLKLAWLCDVLLNPKAEMRLKMAVYTQLNLLLTSERPANGKMTSGTFTLKSIREAAKRHLGIEPANFNIGFVSYMMKMGSKPGYGIQKAFSGMLDGDERPMLAKEMSGIAKDGYLLLGFKEFFTYMTNEQKTLTVRDELEY